MCALPTPNTAETPDRLSQSHGANGLLSTTVIPNAPNTHNNHWNSLGGGLVLFWSAAAVVCVCLCVRVCVCARVSLNVF